MLTGTQRRLLTRETASSKYKRKSTEYEGLKGGQSVYGSRAREERPDQAGEVGRV